MTRNQKKIELIAFTLLLIITGTGAFAQRTFKYACNVQEVDSSAFYIIPLAPEILAKSMRDLADIRLLGQDHKFTPYLFGTRLPAKSQTAFIDFPQVKKIVGTDTATTFIARNAAYVTINQLTLRLRNTSVSRQINLSGGDDLQHWYAIEENLPLAGSGLTSVRGVYEQRLNFPASIYRYYKIWVNNEHKEPVAILQAGIYHTQLASAAYSLLQSPLLIQTESAKTSNVLIKFNADCPVNKLHLVIAGPKLYKRDVTIFGISGKQRFLILDTVLSSSAAANLLFSTRANAIALKIFNGDNPPLAIKSVSAYTLAQSLVGYLEKGKHYQVIFGDSAAIAPDYDLRFFTDSLQHNLKAINTGVIERNVLYKVAAPQPKAAQLPVWALWTIIAAVVLLLVVLTLKLTGEVNKRQG